MHAISLPRIGRLTATLPFGRMLATMVALAFSSSATMADQIKSTKFIEWTFDEKPTKQQTGKYNWKLEGKAKDRDISVMPEDIVGDNTWKLLEGLPLDEKTTNLLGGHPHPQARADLSFFADKAKQSGSLWTIDAQIVSSTQANTVGADQGLQSALAKTTGNMTVSSGVVSGIKVKTEGKKVEVKNATKFEKGSVDFGTHATNKSAKATDPILLTLTDLDTQIAITEELMSFDMATAWDSDLEWDEDLGIIIDVPDDGASSALLSLNMESTWVTNQVLGTSEVSLVDGFFSATGIFADLDWQLNGAQGDITHASLHPDDMPSLVLEYDYPDEMIIDDHMYQETLSFDLGLAVDVAAVPAPGALSLLAFGGLMVMRHRRRPTEV